MGLVHGSMGRSDVVRLSESWKLIPIYVGIVHTARVQMTYSDTVRPTHADSTC